MKKRKGFFITGTDTDAGKTVASLVLMHHYQTRGFKVAAMKPVASGCTMKDGQLKNEDALKLQAQASEQFSYERVNPFAFEAAVSPHLADKNRSFCLSTVVQQFDYLESSSDMVIVEGAGGWLAPVSTELDIADLAVELGLPVILVVGLKLGCINHARLTHDFIQSSAANCCGWLAVSLEQEMPYENENIATLKSKLDVPLLGKIDFEPDLQIAELGRGLFGGQLKEVLK